MDDVARWKWNESQPVSDPKREQELLEKVVERGRSRGLDPELVRAFFAAQMEAARAIQQADFERWKAQNQQPFSDVISLSVLRKQIDTLNEELIEALARMSHQLKNPAVKWSLSRHAEEVLNAPGIAEVRDKVIAPLTK
jgi:chorismate mutase